MVAVLYADALVADKPDEPYWCAFVDVLAMHAGRGTGRDYRATGRGPHDGEADRHVTVLVSGPSVFGEHSVRRFVLILVCAIVALHGLGAQQTSDATHAREAAPAQLTPTRHAPLPADPSQYWFIREVGAFAGGGRPDSVALARFATGRTRDHG